MPKDRSARLPIEMEYQNDKMITAFTEEIVGPVRITSFCTISGNR